MYPFFTISPFSFIIPDFGLVQSIDRPLSHQKGNLERFVTIPSFLLSFSSAYLGTNKFHSLLSKDGHPRRPVTQLALKKSKIERLELRM